MTTPPFKVKILLSVIGASFIVGASVFAYTAWKNSAPSSTATNSSSESSETTDEAGTSPPNAKPVTTPENKTSKDTPKTPLKGKSSGGSTGTTGGQGTSSGNSGGSTTASCSGSANTPGGSDGMGGCFPGANNTGPNAAASSMAAYGGSCTINTPNTVIDSKVINCNIRVNTSGFVIKNSYIYGSVDQPDGVNEAFTIQDSFMDGSSPYACINCGVGYRNFTVLRTEIIGTNRGAYCENTCTIKDSWIHGTNLDPSPANEAHASALRVEQYATLIHNSLACDFTGPFNNDEIGCSADMSGYADFAPIRHNTIDGNLFVANPIGLGYCAYGGGTNGKPYSGDSTNATYIVFTNNVFQRGSNGKCGTWGPVTDFIEGRMGNVWSNNKWNDGTSVSPE